MDDYIGMIAIIYLVVINIIGIAIVKIDKDRAKKKQWRIRERTIFLIAILGGTIGVYYGMQQFRHKTKHLSFVIGIPFIFVVQMVVAILIYKMK